MQTELSSQHAAQTEGTNLDPSIGQRSAGTGASGGPSHGTRPAAGFQGNHLTLQPCGRCDGLSPRAPVVRGGRVNITAANSSNGGLTQLTVMLRRVTENVERKVVRRYMCSSLQALIGWCSSEVMYIAPVCISRHLVKYGVQGGPDNNKLLSHCVCFSCGLRDVSSDRTLLTSPVGLSGVGMTSADVSLDQDRRHQQHRKQAANTRAVSNMSKHVLRR